MTMTHIQHQETILRRGVQEALDNHRTKRIRQAPQQIKDNAIEVAVEAWRHGNCSFTEARDKAIAHAQNEASRE